jgi:hypothetical protein
MLSRRRAVIAPGRGVVMFARRRVVIGPGRGVRMVSGQLVVVMTSIVSVPTSMIIPVPPAVVIPIAVPVVLALVIPAAVAVAAAVAVPVVLTLLIPAAVVVAIAGAIAVPVVPALLFPAAVAVPIAAAVAVRVVPGLVTPAAVAVGVPPLIAIRSAIPWPVAITDLLAVAAEVGQVAAEVGTIGSQAAFVLADALPVLCEIAPIRAQVTTGRVENATPCLLEPVNAVCQFGTGDAVPGPAADDLAEPLAQGTAERRALAWPAKPLKAFQDLRARPQSTPGRGGVVGKDNAVEYQTSRNSCHKAIHDVLLCAGECTRPPPTAGRKKHRDSRGVCGKDRLRIAGWQNR